MKSVRALVFTQKDVRLYCFTMNAMDLEPLCYVEAATRNQEKGIQRVTEVSRLKEIGEFLATGENSFLPNNIILNLKPEVTISDEDGRMATLTFPSDAGDYAFVVDGQHRIFSFRDAYRQLPETDLFELPVVCFHNATEEVMGATFVSINVNQKPVNRDLLTQMKAILGLLDTDIDKACIDLIHDLDEDAASPLKNRILRYPKEKDKWIKTNQLLPVVKGLLLPGGALHEKNHAERKRILIAYLEAISHVFSDAWADQKGKTFALIQTSSIQIVFGLLPDLMQRCDFYEGFNYNVTTFERQLGPLTDTALLGGWKRSAVETAISTQSRRLMFLGQLKEALKLKAPVPSPNKEHST